MKHRTRVSRMRNTEPAALSNQKLLLIGGILLLAVLLLSLIHILRLIRFACQLDFSIEKELFRAARRYAPQIRAISKERIAAELKKILLSDTAYALKRRQPAARKAVILLETTGVLTQLIPEFEGYRALGQCKYHKYNIFLHTANTVGWTPPDLILRYAALFHDVGKVITWQKSGRMIGHDKLGAEIAARRMSLLGVDKRTTELACRLVREQMYDLNGQARESRIRLKIQSMGYENFARLILLREDVYKRQPLYQYIAAQPCQNTGAGSRDESSICR